MAVVIEMPKLSDTMEEGGVAEWFKKEGEFVEEGELLLSIETDKATMEYNSPEEGTLLKIVVEPGSTVGLRRPIAVLGDKGESPDFDTLLKASPESSDAAESSDPVVASPNPESSALATNAQAPASPAPVHAPANAGAAAQSTDRVKASPLAKKLAAQKGLDLRLVSGTGPMGRIIQKDVEDAKIAPLSGAVGAGMVSYQDEVLPNSMMRKTIAKRLLAGKNEAPHFYLNVSADMGAKKLSATNNAGYKSLVRLPRLRNTTRTIVGAECKPQLRTTQRRSKCTATCFFSRKKPSKPFRTPSVLSSMWTPRPRSLVVPASTRSQWIGLPKFLIYWQA